jgi:hypothetical protein
MKKIIVTPNGIQELELTSIEMAQKEQDNIQAQADRTVREEKIAQELANKQSALNKLKALGLNDAEINSILGK